MADLRCSPWSRFARESPDLARFGSERLVAAPSFLATIRGEGLPRLHPVSASVEGGRLALYMCPGSPKGRDLLRDGRYALHAGVADHDGGDGEFFVRGHGRLAEEPDLRRELADAGFPGRDGYELFELGVDEAFSCTYEQGTDSPRIRRWRRT